MNDSNTFLLLRVHWDKDVAEQALVDALAEKIVPQVKKLIEKQARKVAKRHEGTMLAEDAAADILLHKLAEFLMLGAIEEPELLVKHHQMKPKIVHYQMDVRR